MPVGHAGDRSAIEDDLGRTTPVEQGGLVAAQPWQACGAIRRGPAGAIGPPPMYVRGSHPSMSAT